jgi:hypothetical protein
MNVLAQQAQAGDTVTAPLQEGLATVARIVPNILAFVAILIIGFIVAKLIAKALNGVLERVGFDRAVERGGVRKALAKTDYDASDIVAKLIFYTLFLFVLQMAFGVFGPNPISDLLTGVIAYLPQVVAAIVIVVIASAIAKAAKDMLGAFLGGLSYGNTLANVAAGAIVAVGVFAALDTLEIAPRIVNGLFYAILAVIAGSAIIAIGGGGIAPMRARWERAMERMDEESDKMRAEIDRKKVTGTDPAGNGSTQGRTVRLPQEQSAGRR